MRGTIARSETNAIATRASRGKKREGQSARQTIKWPRQQWHCAFLHWRSVAISFHLTGAQPDGFFWYISLFSVRSQRRCRTALYDRPFDRAGAHRRERDAARTSRTKANLFFALQSGRMNKCRSETFGRPFSILDKQPTYSCSTGCFATMPVSLSRTKLNK